MSSPSSKFRSGAAALAALLAALPPARAHAQACCAGGSAVTPARLELHEDFLAGIELHAADVLGSYEVGGHYAGSPPGTSEVNLEQDLFAAARVLGRGQVALLVPIIETQRAVPPALGGSHFGGGVGDINASGRYDFLGAGESLFIPGIAALAGVTIPTGTSPEQASQPLAVDATGIGAWQINGALALEQTFGPWLVNATGILAVRTPRYGQMLAPQVTLLAAAAYTLPSDAALALSASYAFEGDATAGGAPVADSAKRVTTFTLSALYPLTDAWRVLGGFYLEPPASQFGSNQPALSGLTFTGDPVMVLTSRALRAVRVVAAFALLIACASCAARAATPAVVPPVTLAGDGAPRDVRALVADADFTVFVFFSPDCHCLSEHEARLRSLDAEFRPRGVRFFMIDSEVRASVERDAAEAARRGYTFPILVDPGARLAGAVGADYATYSVIVDRSGRLRYRGGIDSDRNHLRPDAVPYLGDALGDLLGGREPRIADAKALGCALQEMVTLMTTLRRLASFAPLFAVAACSSPSSPPASNVDGYASCPTDIPMACPSTVPSWSTEVQPIINRTCALGGQCHGPGGAEESTFNYTTYAGVKQNYPTMAAELESCQMPPNDAVAPSDADWLTMVTWFVCKAPDN